MKKIRALVLLGSFTFDDVAGFQNMITRRYDNKAPMRSLVKMVLKHRKRLTPDVTGDDLRKICKIKINPNTLSNQLTELALLMDDYLIQDELSRDTIQRDSILIAALARRGLVSEVDRIEGIQQKRSSLHPMGLWDQYYKVLALHHRYYYHLSGDPNSDRAIFESLIEHFDQFVADLKAYYSVEMHTRTTLPTEDWSDQIGRYGDYPVEGSLLNSLASELTTLVAQHSEESFRRLRSILEHQADALSVEIKNTIVSYLINYLNQKIRTGQRGRGGELLELYILALEDGYLSKGEKMAERLYTNIIGISCKIGKWAWTAAFVEKYARKVDPNYEEEIKKVGRAYLNFYSGSYREVIQDLAVFSHQSESLRFKMRWLHISACYEVYKDEPAFMMDEINKFMKYLKSPKSMISRSVMEGSLNSCKVMRLLIGTSSKDEVVALRHSFPIFNGMWIDQKIKEKFL